MVGGWSKQLRPLHPWETDPVPIVQGPGWTPGTIWTGAKIFTHNGIRSPDRPALSESLYRLPYPSHLRLGTDRKFIYVLVPEMS